ncbi:hypothetical protein GpartN1_g4033.t1 [Galdieria partita]|uniref:Ribosomal RNA small subunit methyltransferase NEP1 n=1 Tax=Galdieria partita TaxID=83374 RepID=A0A9C7PYJ2_9RHOD|nr:hypothetical protein GpartN1_g4033.t1 [Galdieria partita]
MSSADDIGKKRKTMEEDDQEDGGIYQNTILNRNIDSKLEHESARLSSQKAVLHSRKKVTFLLEQASLELVKIDRNWEILNGDEHQQYMKRKNLNPADYRPDIVHQCVLSLLDSPLNKAGYLDLYIHTTSNALIKVNPQTRIPRTLKRFCGLMVQLLQDLKIFGHGVSKPLLQVIRNPITDHLPGICWKTVCSYNCENLKSPYSHGQEVIKKDIDILYVVGAMAHGKIVEEWADEELKISSFPLSASAVCHRICSAYETLYEVL